MSWQDHRHLAKDDYQLLVSRLGMNKSQAGRFLGVSLRTAQRYWDGKTPVPVASALLLRSMHHHRELPRVPPWPGRRAAERYREKPSVTE